MIDVSVVSVKDLHVKLGFSTPIDYPASSLAKPLTKWNMEIDDAPIFRYLYRNFMPKRHLEFGTWQGTGVLYCLEECDATAWTINLLEGEEKNALEKWAYNSTFSIFKRLPTWNKKKRVSNSILRYQTDSFGFIGRYYLEKNLGNRVCQIYCDSREWNISNYPKDFFDTALIDGGHSEDVVINDTRKALQLLRSGGMIMWHDFTPQIKVYKKCSSVQGVTNAIRNNWNWINSMMKDIFWINPSWILLGIKK